MPSSETAITSTGATLHADVTDVGDGAPTLRFFYGTSDGGLDPGAWDASAAMAGTHSGPVSFPVTGLAPATSYVVGVRAINSAGESWALANQAFETLRDPVKRSRYLLELNGASLPDDSATTADAEFLMEQIELREEVDSCRQGEDAFERSEKIESRLGRRAHQLAHDFVEHFDAGNIDAAIDSSRKMQFIQRIQQQLSELQFELEAD